MKIAWWSVTKHVCLPNRSPGPLWGLIQPVWNGLQGWLPFIFPLLCSSAVKDRFSCNERPWARSPGGTSQHSSTSRPFHQAAQCWAGYGRRAMSKAPVTATAQCARALWSGQVPRVLPSVRAHQLLTGEPTELGIQEYSLPCKCGATPQNPITHPFSCPPFLKQCLRTVPSSP